MEKPEFYVDNFKVQTKVAVLQKKDPFEGLMLNPEDYPALIKKRAQKTRQEINSEAIRIKYKDKNKKIPRKRLTTAILNRTFKTRVHYLVDKTHQVFFEHEWKKYLLPWNPDKVLYTIIPKDEEVTEIDTKRDPDFDGQTNVYIVNVTTEVEEEALRHWMRVLILDDDLAYKAAKVLVEDTKKDIEENNKRIKNIPFVEIITDTEEEERKQRLAMATYLNAEKVRLEEELKARKFQAHRYEAELLLEDLDLFKCNINEKLQRCDWRVKFGGEFGYLREESVVNKMELDLFRTFRDMDGKEYVTLKKEPPDDWDRDKEINLRGARIVRRPKGKGTRRFGAKADYTYTGFFDEGKFHGFGEMTTPYFYYKGGMHKGLRKGKAMLMHRNGTVYEGPVDARVYHTDTKGNPVVPLLNGTEYHDGVPHTKRSSKAPKARIMFADGGLYEGQMNNGRVTGKGKYTAGNGDTYEGTFVDGVLNGPKCRFTANSGYVQEGPFRNGKVHGDGVLRHVQVEHPIYEGTFQHGVFDGHGVRTVGCSETNDYRYKGEWRDGLRDGVGRLMYGNFQICKDKATTNVYYENDYVYQGFWRAGRYCARSLRSKIDYSGLHPDTQYYASDNKDREKFPWLHSLHQREDDLHNKILAAKLKGRERAAHQWLTIDAARRDHFTTRYERRMVKTTLDLQKSAKKLKKYEEKLVELKAGIDKRREELAAKELDIKRKRVLNTLLKSAKEPAKLAQEQQDMAIKHMAEKKAKVSREIENYNKNKLQQQASSWSQKAKQEADKLARININRRKQGLPPLKILKDADPKPVKEDAKAMTQEDMVKAIREAGGFSS